MKFLYNYNPPEVAFYLWISNYPFSAHQTDDCRFYSFILTVNRYKRQGQRWRNKEYFIKRIRDFGFHQDESELREKYEEMMTVLAFLESKALPIFRKTSFYISEDETPEVTYIARAIINNEISLREISSETYKKNKVNKKTFVANDGAGVFDHS